MKKKEKYVKGVMKKSECDIWKEFTYGAWWLPFEKNGSNLAWQKKKKSKWGNNMLRYCKKCDRAVFQSPCIWQCLKNLVLNKIIRAFGVHAFALCVYAGAIVQKHQ